MGWASMKLGHTTYVATASSVRKRNRELTVWII